MSDTEFEDLNWYRRPANRLPKRRPHWKLRRIGIALLVGAFCAGAFWLFWKLGHLIRGLL